MSTTSSPSSSSSSSSSPASLLNKTLTIKSLPLSRIFTGTFLSLDYNSTLILSGCHETRFATTTVVDEAGAPVERVVSYGRSLGMVSVSMSDVTEVWCDGREYLEMEYQSKLLAKECAVGGVD
jgi:hypothetical protein